MKSPGGSLFPYYYKGGEIHCLKYGNKYKDHEKLYPVDEIRRGVYSTNKSETANMD
jgi:hypothetical protein